MKERIDYGFAGVLIGLIIFYFVELLGFVIGIDPKPNWLLFSLPFIIGIALYLVGLVSN